MEDTGPNSRAPRRGKGQLGSTSNATERGRESTAKGRESSVWGREESHLDSKGTGKDQGWDRMGGRDAVPRNERCSQSHTFLLASVAPAMTAMQMTTALQPRPKQFGSGNQRCTQPLEGSKTKMRGRGQKQRATINQGNLSVRAPGVGIGQASLKTTGLESSNPALWIAEHLPGPSQKMNN